MQFVKRQLVPVTALERNLVIDHAKESATAESFRIFPFQDGPLAVFKDVFRDAYHFGLRKFPCEHLPDVFFSNDRLVSNLVVDGVVGVQVCQPFGVRIVKRVESLCNEFFGCHCANVALFTGLIFEKQTHI